MPNIIECHSVSFGYETKGRILKDLSLGIPQGSVYGVLGVNGAGKSTLFKILLRLLVPDTGTVSYWGSYDFKEDYYYKIGSSIDEPAYIPYLTVREHLEMEDIIFEKGEARVEEVLKQTNLTKEADKLSSKLSLGNKQRLALALAIFRDPELLILDEPTNGLDPLGIIETRNLLEELHLEGRTIIYSSHNLSELEKICTNICIIKDGTIAWQGPITDIHSDLESFFLEKINGETTKIQSV